MNRSRTRCLSHPRLPNNGELPFGSFFIFGAAKKTIIAQSMSFQLPLLQNEPKPTDNEIDLYFK